jgi:adenylate kinase
VLRSLLLAPPGAGKGTQGERVAAIYGVSHLATGDLLRNEVAKGTRLGHEAEAYMSRGELVPDRLVLDVVARHIAGPEPLAGFVLDGFPRTLAQARTAYEWGREHDRTFHAVVSLEVPEAELVHRLVERGARLGRADDTEATIRRRLEVFAATTRPLLDFYADRGVLVVVDGTGPVDDVTARVRAALDPLVAAG